MTDIADRTATDAPPKRTAAVAPRGVNHLVLNVRDIEESHHFWSDLLGFRQVGNLVAAPDGRERPTMRFYSGVRDAAQGQHHHDIALMEQPDLPPPPEKWTLSGGGGAVNHIAITYPDRESWLEQVKFLMDSGVRIGRRTDHGMTHSIYITDPNEYGVEVLYDLPRLKGVPWLEPGTRITVEDLEAWEEMAGVRVGPGDAFLVRWGRWARQDALGPFDTGREAAGLDNHVIPWLRERDVAVAGWETPGYAPQPEGDLPRTALHNFALTILGIQVLDRADFQALAVAAAARNRWEFMVTIAPLPIPNGTGSPVNPIAMF